MANEKDQLAISVVNNMMENDLFSQWLGVIVLEIKEGYSKIKMTCKKGNDQWFWHCTWWYSIQPGR
jgi:acyl-CoA thioesterase